MDEKYNHDLNDVSGCVDGPGDNNINSWRSEKNLKTKLRTTIKSGGNKLSFDESGGSLRDSHNPFAASTVDQLREQLLGPLASALSGFPPSGTPAPPLDDYQLNFHKALFSLLLAFRDTRTKFLNQAWAEHLLSTGQNLKSLRRATVQLEQKHNSIHQAFTAEQKTRQKEQLRSEQLANKLEKLKSSHAKLAEQKEQERGVAEKRVGVLTHELRRQSTALQMIFEDQQMDMGMPGIATMGEPVVPRGGASETTAGGRAAAAAKTGARDRGAGAAPPAPTTPTRGASVAFAAAAEELRMGDLARSPKDSKNDTTSSEEGSSLVSSDKLESIVQNENSVGGTGNKKKARPVDSHYDIWGPDGPPAEVAAWGVHLPGSRSKQ